MFDLSSVYFESIIYASICLFGIYILLKESHFWDSSKRNIVKMILGLLLVGVTVFVSFKYIPACFDLKISAFEGIFKETRNKYSILIKDFFFTDEENESRGFSLDLVTKRNILKDDFEKGKK